MNGCSFRISDRIQLCVSVAESLDPYVIRAAEDLCADLERITGRRPELAAAPAGENCIVIERAGDGWERHSISSLPGNRLRIAGADGRGAMFGVYAFLDRWLGVDPFEYWTGREPEKRSELFWEEIEFASAAPSFRFRGWFINDEDLLEGFRSEGRGVRKLDYPFYSHVVHRDLIRKIAETAVRAQYNLIIPESFVDILNPDEKMLLDECAARGLYLSMHHVEPMGVSGFSFRNYWAARGREYLYSYFKEPEAFRTIWREYAEAWAEYPDVIWQIGLRGIADRPIWYADPDIPPDDAGRAALISAALAEQIRILTEVLGHAPEHVTTTLWAEGAEFYGKKLLEIPEGVTLVFSDNCAGWRMQPDCTEAEILPGRKYGLYYHHSIIYGTHMSQAVPPARTWQVLAEARARGIGEYVIFNVSNIREFVYGIAAGSEIARDVAAFDPGRFREEWVSRRFSAGREAISRAYELYFNSFELHPDSGVAMFTDGLICRCLWETVRILSGKESEKRGIERSRHLGDEYALLNTGKDSFEHSLRDMFPRLASRRRTVQLLAAQAAGFELCGLELEQAETSLPAAEREFLFDQLVYPAGFMRRLSDAARYAFLCREMRLAGNPAESRRFLEQTVASLESVLPLMERYCHGKWAAWYDNCRKLDWKGILNELRAIVAAAR